MDNAHPTWSKQLFTSISPVLQCSTVILGLYVLQGASKSAFKITIKISWSFWKNVDVRVLNDLARYTIKIDAHVQIWSYRRLHKQID